MNQLNFNWFGQVVTAKQKLRMLNERKKTHSFLLVIK